MAVESAPGEDKQTNKEVNGNRDNERLKFREQQGELVLDRIYVGGLGQDIYEKDLYGFSLSLARLALLALSLMEITVRGMDLSPLLGRMLSENCWKNLMMNL
jgi:hypothetical protein